MSRLYVRVTLDVDGLETARWQEAFRTPGLRLGHLDYCGGAFLTLGGSPRAVQEAGRVLGIEERVMAEVMAVLAGNPTPLFYKCGGVEKNGCGRQLPSRYSRGGGPAPQKCLECSLQESLLIGGKRADNAKLRLALRSLSGASGSQ